MGIKIIRVQKNAFMDMNKIRSGRAQVDAIRDQLRDQRSEGPVEGMHIFFLTPELVAGGWWFTSFAYSLPKSTIRNTQHDLEGIFCDLHKAPA